MYIKCLDHIEYIKSHTIDPGPQPHVDISCSSLALCCYLELKEIKCIQIRKEDVKLLIFADVIIVYISEPKILSGNCYSQ